MALRAINRTDRERKGKGLGKIYRLKGCHAI